MQRCVGYLILSRFGCIHVVFIDALVLHSSSSASKRIFSMNCSRDSVSLTELPALDNQGSSCFSCFVTRELDIVFTALDLFCPMQPFTRSTLVHDFVVARLFSYYKFGRAQTPISNPPFLSQIDSHCISWSLNYASKIRRVSFLSRSPLSVVPGKIHNTISPFYSEDVRKPLPPQSSLPL